MSEETTDERLGDEQPADQQAPDETAAPESEPQPLPRPRKRTIGLAVALALLCIFATAVTAYVTVKGGIRQALEGVFTPDLPTVFGKDQIRVLVMGVDDSWTDTDEVYTSQSRSDTNIAVSIDLHSHQIGVVSIPRDLWVDIPKDGYGKLNEAIADGGPERTEATLEKNLSTPPFDYYMVLNINATKEVVDAIGGLDVDVEKDMDYDDNWGHLHIHLKKGPHHLDGDQVVGYIRYRHDAEGDFGRMRRQRQVVQLLVKRLKDPSIAMHVVPLIGVVRQNVRTNLSFEQMLDLAKGLQDVTPQMVHEAEVPANVGWTDGESVLFADQSQAQSIIHKYLVVGFSNTFDPSTVHVKVENGSGTPGAASAMADYLRRRGFTIVETGNASTFNNPRTKITGADQKVVAEVVKDLPVHDPAIAVGTVQGGDVDIVVGQDYRTQ
ncbi:MAG TPA: LCP family protein [Candidatus Eremiobacteraceae bacterium]